MFSTFTMPGLVEQFWVGIVKKLKLSMKTLRWKHLSFMKLVTLVKGVNRGNREGWEMQLHRVESFAFQSPGLPTWPPYLTAPFILNPPDGLLYHLAVGGEGDFFNDCWQNFSLHPTEMMWLAITTFGLLFTLCCQIIFMPPLTLRSLEINFLPLTSFFYFCTGTSSLYF